MWAGLTGDIPVHGTYDPKFARMVEAFVSNFEGGGNQDIGVSFAATIDDEMVVDIWAGHADVAKTRPWEHDTIGNVWPTTKSLVMMCIHILVDCGLLDLEAPVIGRSSPFERGGHRQRNPGGSLWQRPYAQRSIASGHRLYARLQRTPLGLESSHFRAHRSGRLPGHGRLRRSCFLDLHHEPSAHALQR